MALRRRLHIRQVADVRRSRCPYAVGVLIKIWVEGEPPVGRVESEVGRHLSFAGWLQLLKLLSELIQLPREEERFTGR